VWGWRLRVGVAAAKYLPGARIAHADSAPCCARGATTQMRAFRRRAVPMPVSFSSSMCPCPHRPPTLQFVLTQELDGRVITCNNARHMVERPERRAHDQV